VCQLWRIYSNNGKVGIGVIACQLGGIFASVRQVNNDRAGFMNNVAIRQNESIRRDHEPGAVPAEFALSSACADALFYVDINYGWRDARDCADNRPRIRVEYLGVVWLRFAADWL
jgi:hypothetical protein